MKVLAIDTSSYANIVSVTDGERILVDCNIEAGTDSLEKIISNIEQALESAGVTLGEIDGIGVGLGPGSWTGIRVGVTVGKMLAYSTGKPVCGVPTIDALAYGTCKGSSVICPVISAGTKDTIYAAFYRPENGMARRISEYYVGHVTGLTELVNEPTVFVGSHIESHREQIVQALVQSNINADFLDAWLPGPSIARLAARRLENNDSDDVLALTPLYLKESTARAFTGRHGSK
ncbi:tRNA (adenosine(37)-N6)-threonylcarbamoyltransferase complex dimerization subunit type 1 TsaB [Chloroflexota bacterium]